MTFWRLAASSLYGVSPTDPVVVITASSLLLIMMILACVVPARNAARVDPIKTLRTQ
jgi:ABC-type lipoprotein release transport system permease subunit